MGDLSKMSDSAKVDFLMAALEDAAAAMRMHSLHDWADLYDNYVREIRGEQKESSHE